MSDAAATEQGERLAEVFRRIAATRMVGMPILNPALEVEAIGFRPWRDVSVGVLITPWFMSLICLPGRSSRWAECPSGSTRELELPSASYELLTASEESLGPYLTGSLFSPMFAFEDMEQARSVASSILDQVFKAPEAGAESGSEFGQGLDRGPGPGGGAVLQRPLSRRGFLGSLLVPGGRS